MTTPTPSIGHLIRHWRERRRLSQLQLAGDAEISCRHLSFIETGRSSPSRAMVLRLAEHLDVPLRERNHLLTAAGYAPVFRERALDDPSMQPARLAVDRVLKGHEPYPALALDRHWNVLASNSAATALLAGAGSDLLKPPVNVLRLSLHPLGLAPRIANLGQWRAHLLERLSRQIGLTDDPVLVELRDELEGYPCGAHSQDMTGSTGGAQVVVPLLLETPAGLLSFFSTTMIFGTPVDVTLSELAIESFFPADEKTSAALARLGECSDTA